MSEEVKAPESAAPSWYVTEELPGQGERPAFLQPRYKTLAAQAEAYVDLEKRFGGFTGAPESYDLVTLSDRLAAEIPADAPLVKVLADTAKSLNMSQEGFDRLMGSIVESQKDLRIDPAAERAKLGEGAEQQIATLKQWAENNFGPDEVALVTEMLDGPAEQVRLLQKMRSMTSKSAIPTTQETSEHLQPKQYTERELDAEMALNYSRYQDDPRYRAELMAKYRHLYPT